MFEKCKIYKHREPMDLDENLGTFFQCIDPWNSKLWYTKQMHMRKNLGIRMMEDWQLDRLCNSFNYKKHMGGCVNYDILSNYKYTKLFAYVPIELRDTPEEKATSDSLEVILNAAFVPDNRDFNID